MTRGETGWAYKNNEDGPWFYSPGEPEICWKKRQFNVDQFLTALDTRSDYLMPNNEDFRQGYSVGYAHAYGDVSDLKAKLDEFREEEYRLGAQADFESHVQDLRRAREWV